MKITEKQYAAIAKCFESKGTNHDGIRFVDNSSVLEVKKGCEAEKRIAAQKFAEYHLKLIIEGKQYVEPLLEVQKKLTNKLVEMALNDELCYQHNFSAALQSEAESYISALKSLGAQDIDISFLFLKRNAHLGCSIPTFKSDTYCVNYYYNSTPPEILQELGFVGTYEVIQDFQSDDCSESWTETERYKITRGRITHEKVVENY